MYADEDEFYVRQHQQHKAQKFAKSLDSFKEIADILDELISAKIISGKDKDEILDLVADKLDL